MNNTIQLYVDDEKQVKGFPLTSPDRVIDSNGKSIKDKLKNNVKFDVVGEGANIPPIDGKYDDTEIREEIESVTDEISDARNGEEKLGNTIKKINKQLDNIDKRLDFKNTNSVNIGNINLFDERIFTNKFYKITDIFPNVTLLDVQTVDKNATLNDSADWFVVASMIHNAHSNNIGYIELPKGVGIMSRELDITKKLYRCDIKGKSSCLKAHSNFTGKSLIKLSPDDGAVNWATSRLVRIDGVFIDGNYSPNIYGVYIKKAQEWLITNCSIHRCFVGVAMEDTWYGEMSLENIIQDCVRGIEMLIGSTNEVNTIKFNNVKINCTLSLEQRKKLLLPKEGESDEDYKLRVPTVGIRFRTILGGIEFNGCVIEGQDIGFLSDCRTVEEDGSLGTNGTNTGILNIDNCYLEAIKRKFYHISNTTKNGAKVKYDINISNTRHYAPQTIPEVSIFDMVRLRVSNCQNINAKLMSSYSRSTITFNDSWNIETDVSNQIIYSDDRVQESIRAAKFNVWGDTNVYPMGKTTYANIQEGLGTHMIHTKGNYMMKNHKMMEVTHLSSIYMPSVYSKCGPVITGDDGKYYMLQVDVNGKLVPRAIDNIYKLVPPIGSYNTKELWINRKKITGVVMWADQNAEVRYEIINGYDTFYTGTTIKYPKILKYEAFLKKRELGFSVAYGGLWVHLIDIDIKVTDDGNDYVDWYGRRHTGLKAIGTISQRPIEVPTEAIGFKFIATDENKVYEWDMVNKTYKEFTPYNVG